MIPVKICGITNIDDALCASENEAAAVGFIFYPASSRYIEPARAGEIIERLPKHLVRVGVFVNEDVARICNIYDTCRLDMIQLHGDETPGYCGRFPKQRIIKALALETQDNVQQAADFGVAAILVDSRHSGLYGGTGRISNWTLAGRIKQPFILAGGLSRHNIPDALKALSPDALDINSGVESSPGRKDKVKIRQVMQVIRKADFADRHNIIFTKREDR